MKDDGLKIIGLTGGIGAGKSIMSAYLSEKGYPIIDADKIAREIVKPGAPVLSKLVSVFGKDILNEDGTLDRKKLAGMVFGDDALRERLNGIMHGEIVKIMKERIDTLTLSGYNSFVFLDIPLLFETDTELTAVMDEIWVIDADENVRIERIMKRDGISRQDVLNIIKNQMSSEEKRKRADVVIENAGSEEELYQKLDKLIQSHEQ
jgi:dephospho-CoA kinase